MPYRLTKIYTRQGDEGYTTLGDQKLAKDDLLVEAVGTLDELNSFIGLVLSYPIQTQSVKEMLTRVQNELFDMGGELHMPQYRKITADHVKHLEKIIDEWNATLAPLEEFILPRGTTVTATCHVARTVCRRAERRLVKLNHQVTLENSEMLRYLNRLSDLLFVAARILSKENNEEELMWNHERVKK